MIYIHWSVVWVGIHTVYCTSDTCECAGVNGEDLQVCAELYLLLQVTQESTGVLQVTCAKSEQAMN